MPHTRLAFSDRAIAVLPFASSGQHIVRDKDVPGFFLLVGTRSKTFMIQGDLWLSGKRRSVRLKIGEVGKITTREARAKAKMLLGSIADGVDPRPKPQEPPSSDPTGADRTLRQGWERYRDGHMKREELSKWGNDLRQTFRTIAQAVGVPELDVHLLMNHSIPGVNAGYITRNKLLRDHLWSQQEAISRKIVDAMRTRSASALWINTSSRQLAGHVAHANA